MSGIIYSKPEVLLGDLRGGLCSSGLCKQLRAVAADEIERLGNMERDSADIIQGQSADIARLTRERNEAVGRAEQWRIQAEGLDHDLMEAKVEITRLGSDLQGVQLGAEGMGWAPGRTIPPEETRRQAFESWWQSMWADGNPKSSPAFDQQMKAWNQDAWRAGAEYERQRMAAQTPEEL